MRRSDPNQILHVNSLGGRSNIFNVTSKWVEGFRRGGGENGPLPLTLALVYKTAYCAPAHTREPLNRHISAAVPLILKNFRTITHIGPMQRIDRYNWEFLKIQVFGGSVPHKRNVPKFRQLIQNGRLG